MRCILSLLTLAACGFAMEPAKLDTSTPVGQAFALMYNLDFSGAHAVLDHQIRLDPQGPLPYSVKAAAYLFAELHRLRILQIEFFEDDDKVVDRRRLIPDPAVRQEFFRLVDTSRQRADARLAARPGDRDAMFALCMAAGLATDYAALVERRRFGSFALARKAQAAVRRTETLNPPLYDALLATGVTEYVVGSLPFYFRWFVRIDNIKGNKQKGIQTLELIAERGRYYGPFARVILAAIHMREKRFGEAERLLAVVSTEYPGNSLLRRELQRAATLSRGSGAIGRASGAER